MIFPINVYRNIKEAGKTRTSEKISAIAICALIVNIIVFAQFQGVLQGIGISPVVTIIFQLIITILIVILLIRVFVVRENDKYAEHEKSKGTSLSNYYYIRNKENVDKIDEVPIFQYSNGNYFFILGFTYGANSERKKIGNEEFFTRLARNVLKYEMRYRCYEVPEDFRESVECKTFLKSLMNIEDPNLKDYMSKMIEYDLDYCTEYRELFKTVILVETSNPYQVNNVSPLIREILKDYKSLLLSVRGIDFFDVQEMRNFCRDYHCLEALDLSSLKVNNIDKNTLLDFKNLVKVERINLKNGKIREVVK